MPGELPTPTRSFVLGLADEHGALDGPSLTAAADAAGFSATKLRLALMRLRDAGLVTLDGRGRSVQVQLTADGLAARSPDQVWVAAAYRLDAGLDPWDGVWHLAAFEIPERQRTARDAVRAQIVELFGASLSGGLYVSPRAWEPWLDVVAERAGVGDRLTTATTSELRHAGRSAPTELAAALWPVEELDADYRRFVTTWAPLLDAVPALPDAVRAAFTASAELEALLRQDPLLPPDLAPGDGPANARRLYLDLIDALGTHELLGRANLFSSYGRTIELALGQSPGRFWRWAFAETTAG